MKVYLTRESVCAGDDADAPHVCQINVPAGSSIEEVLSIVARSGYLASIAGGQATWSAVSRIPLAVMAQQWTEPKMLSPFPIPADSLDICDQTLRIHFNYYAQEKPEVVYSVLARTQLFTAGAENVVAQRRMCLSPYLPLLAIAIELPWLVVLFMSSLLLGGDAAFTYAPATKRLLDGVSALPALAGIILGVVCIVRGGDRRGMESIFLFGGCAGCAAIIYSFIKGVW